MRDITSLKKADLKAARQSATRYAMYVFWIMFGINFLNYMDRYVLSGAANVIAKELGFGIDGIGYIASAFLIVYTLGTVPLGIWADRAKRKDVIAICVAIWSLATAFTALATNFITMFISRMVLGIGEAGYFPAGTALMSDYFSRDKRSRIMSWWNVGQLVGILVGLVVGGEVAGLYVGSWRLAFLLTGIPGLIFAFLAWRLREPRRNQADEEAAELDPTSLSSTPEMEEAAHTIAVSTNILSQFGSLLRIKTLMVLIVMQIFAYFVLGVNSVFLPTYLQQRDTFSMSSGNAGLFSGAVIVFAGMAGTILGGYMADLLNRRYPGARVLVCGIGFLLSAPTFAVAVITHNLIIFSICSVVTVLLVLVYQGPSTAATQDVVPSMLRASGVALSLLIAHLLGDAFAPTLVGALATAFDPTHGGHFRNSVAGHDLSLALIITCVPALIVAGLVGIFGARWMKGDIEAAEQVDRLAKAGE